MSARGASTAGRIAGIGLAVGSQLVAFEGCDRLLQLDGPTTVHDAGPPIVAACGVTARNDGCAACVATRCCGVAQACASAPSCTAYENCVLPCGADYACRAQCMITHPPIDQAIPSLDQCISTSCASECGLSCGQPFLVAEPDAAQGCAECMATNACAEELACGASAQCLETLRCGAVCATVDCGFACATGPNKNEFFADGLKEFSACKRACSIGSYWDCRGDTILPLGPPHPSTVTIVLLNQGTDAPEANASITACVAGDVTCAHPVATATTDTTGQATVTLPSESALGFQGYLELSGPDIDPYLYFFLFPVSAEAFSLLIYVGSSAQVDDLFRISGTPRDPTRGILGPVATDCHWFAAADTTISATGMDDQTRIIYASTDAYLLDAGATTELGLADFLNAPVGPTTLSVTRVATGEIVSQASVFVRAGAITSIALRPNR